MPIAACVKDGTLFKLAAGVASRSRSAEPAKYVFGLRR